METNMEISAATFVRLLTCGVAIGAVSWATAVHAQQPPPGAADVTALAKQTQNPVGDLVSVPLQFNFNTAGDLEDATLFNLNIQPVIPFKAWAGWNIIARAIVPIDNVPANDGLSYSGVGDIQLQLYATPAKPGSLIWGVGPVFSFPTATAFPLRSGTLAAGAAAVALTMKGPWVIGGLVSQYWPATDTGDSPETNLFWDAASGDQWTVPLGLGVTRTTVFSGRPLNIGMQYFVNAVRPDGSAQRQLRFSMSLLYPKK
jgi:hypothetical protein